MILPLLLIGGGIAALMLSHKDAGRGSVATPDSSALVNGQAYHVIVRTNVRSDSSQGQFQDFGVMAGPLDFMNVREVSADDNDPFVYRFVADWNGATGAFITDNPGMRIVGVTALDGNG